jgi:hypothetical protein
MFVFIAFILSVAAAPSPRCYVYSDTWSSQGPWDFDKNCTFKCDPSTHPCERIGISACFDNGCNFTDPRVKPYNVYWCNAKGPEWMFMNYEVPCNKTECWYGSDWPYFGYKCPCGGVNCTNAIPEGFLRRKK